MRLTKNYPASKSHPRGLKALAAPPVPHFPRLRALALFGRRPPQLVDSLVMPASENLHITGLCPRLPMPSLPPPRPIADLAGATFSMKRVPAPGFGSLISRLPLGRMKRLRPIKTERELAYRCHSLGTSRVQVLKRFQVMQQLVDQLVRHILFCQASFAQYQLCVTSLHIFAH